MKRVAILGAGGMGTALAVLFSQAVRRRGAISLAAQGPGQVGGVNSSTRASERPALAFGVPLPDNVSVLSNACDATGGAELIVVAIPSAYLRQTLDALAEKLPPRVPVLSVIKGIENATFARPSQIIEATLGPRSIAILSGPGHAEELARGLPASLVVAGADEALNVRVRDTLNQRFLRVYTNPDALGVELAGALKNVLAIAAGMCDGLGFGDNAKAALITRGLVEIARFGVQLGAHPATFQGLAGVGDVLTTCYSAFGRNRGVGERIGKGETLEQVLSGMVNVAEGVPTTRSVRDMALQGDVDMPITCALSQILFEGKSPLEAVTDFMLRSPKVELHSMSRSPLYCRRRAASRFKEWAGRLRSTRRRTPVDHSAQRGDRRGAGRVPARALGILALSHPRSRGAARLEDRSAAHRPRGPPSRPRAGRGAGGRG